MFLLRDCTYTNAIAWLCIIIFIILITRFNNLFFTSDIRWISNYDSMWNNRFYDSYFYTQMFFFYPPWKLLSRYKLFLNIFDFDYWFLIDRRGKNFYYHITKNVATYNENIYSAQINVDDSGRENEFMTSLSSQKYWRIMIVVIIITINHFARCFCVIQNNVLRFKSKQCDICKYSNDRNYLIIHNESKLITNYALLKFSNIHTNNFAFTVYIIAFVWLSHEVKWISKQ